MNLVDINNIVRTILNHALHHELDTILEVAAILRPRNQHTHVEHEDVTTQQALRHLLLLDTADQAPYQCRLAHAGLANMQRIVLFPSAEHLDGALQLLFSANQFVALLNLLVHQRHQLTP